jgi:ParB family chromosome partitioning protein
MATVKDLASGRSDLYKVNPLIIKEEQGWNVRQAGEELDNHIRFLANSIKEEGVREPMTCYLKEDSFFLTNGHCRLMAVKLAISEGSEIETVPVRVEDRYSNESDRVLSMITRNSGKPLTQLETAEVIKRLLKFGWDMQKVAAKTGYGMQTIKNILELSMAPEDILELVKDGQVAPSLARQTIKENGSKKATEILTKAAKVSKANGKKKVTEKDIKKKINWNKYGPLCLEKLEDISAGRLTDKMLISSFIANIKTMME